MNTEASVCRTQKPCPAPSPAPSILVIDDDEDFRALARRMLETAGFEVRTAASVAEGLKAMQSRAADLVILDIVMPGCDGIEGLEEFGRRFPAARILTISGAADSELYLKVSDYLGAVASLDKSRIASLCSLLNVVLERGIC